MKGLWSTLYTIGRLRVTVWAEDRASQGKDPESASSRPLFSDEGRMYLSGSIIAPQR